MNARDYAIYLLDRTFLPGWTSRIIEFRDNLPPEDPRDLDLAEQVQTGVTKNLILLQRLVQHYSGRTMRSISEPIQKMLAAGIYQIRELTRIPAPAVVFETVEQSRRLGFPQAAGFCNAILRKCADRPKENPPFGNDPSEMALVLYSHQKVVYHKIRKLVGVPAALELCKHHNRTPPIIVRLLGKTSVEDLNATGLSAVAHADKGLAVLTEARREQLAKLANEGMAQVQDATSAATVSYLDVQPGQAVLDRCAGRGTKTMQILDLAGKTGRVVAMDSDAKRIESLRASVAARGATNVNVVLGKSMADVADAPKRFDRILIDAPCSNSGVLARRAEARFHQTDRELESVQNLQRDILLDTIGELSVGGKLVYATCSIWPEENEQQVRWLLSQDPKLALLEEKSTLPNPTEDPTQYRDGGYVAVLTRR
ncbi:MAG: transcription antitermination factor NusB [Tepidisphaeraceae bacterium]